MSYDKEKESISWDKVRKDFKARVSSETGKEVFDRLTYVANNFMRKGIHDLNDLSNKRMSDLKAKGIGRKGRAILVVLANHYGIPIKISSEELVAYSKDMDKTKQFLQIAIAK